MMRERGTCWPATLTPPLWPFLTSDLMWNVGRRCFIGKGPNPLFVDFEQTVVPVVDFHLS